VKRWAYPGLAFLTGAGVTLFEFAAPNLFRAYFGQTVFVWANVIGVILGALALGYALGGRWADRTTSLLPLAWVLAFAGVYALLVGAAGPAISGWLAGPEEYTPDAALHAFIFESLAASLILFGPPLVALGMASPLLVQRATKHWPVGRATGLIFGVGTVGSIAGIYLTTFLLVPLMGVRATITLSAAVLLLLAGLVFLIAKRRAVAAVALLGLVLVPFGLAPAWADLPPRGSRTIVAYESPYQLVRVVDRLVDQSWQRWLMFDEGMGTYHSIRVDKSNPWTNAYYDAFAFAPKWLGADPGQTLRICVVGYAAGSMGELLVFHNPGTGFWIDGVEIDPYVTRAARETMGLDDLGGRVRLFHADGRTFLKGRAANTYDIIFMDAYARQVSIPATLATREFFALAKSRLADGGMLFVNLGALRAGGLLVKTIADTMAAGFRSEVFIAPLDQQQNVLLVAAKGGPPPAPPDETPLLVGAAWGRHLAGDRVLTDDFCPVEFLTMKDLLLR